MIKKIPKGVIIDQHRATDYFSGANSPIGLVEVLPNGNWTQYLPSSERQKLKNGDTFSCVTFSALNALETQLNYLIASRKLTIKQAEFLNDNGYIDEFSKVNFDDSYTAKMSGTIPGQGNSLFNVANSIRHDGLLPQTDYTTPTVEEFYRERTEIEKVTAKEIYKYFEFNYEWVFSDFEKHLKQAPLQIATGVCNGWSTSAIIQNCSLPVSHATMLYNALPDYWEDFDSYEPYNLKLAKDYSLPYVLKLLISNKKYMRYVTVDKEQYLLDDELKLALNIGDELELAELKKWGLAGSPLPIANINGYAIYPLVRKSRLRDLFGF